VHKILVTSRSFGCGESGKELDKLFRRHGLEAEFSPLEQIGDRIEQFEGIIVGTEAAGAQVFRRAKALRAIIKYGAGTDNIDSQAARQGGIRVLSLPGINSDTVAEMALGLMFALARKIAAGDRALRREKADRPLGQPVCGKILGVIGTGAVGTALVRMVSGLAMEVLAYDIRKNPDLVDLGVRYLPMLENTVCTPHIAAYTGETLRKMDEACLSALSETLEAGREEARQKDKYRGGR